MDGARLVQSPALIQFEILMVPDIERRVVRKKPCCCIYTKMIMDFYIYIYIHIYIYEPHSEQSEYVYTTLQGSEVLRECGWKPYCMHRVGRFVHEALLIDGWLVYVGGGT